MSQPIVDALVVNGLQSATMMKSPIRHSRYFGLSLSRKAPTLAEIIKARRASE